MSDKTPTVNNPQIAAGIKASNTPGKPANDQKAVEADIQSPKGGGKLAKMTSGTRGG